VFLRYLIFVAMITVSACTTPTQEQKMQTALDVWRGKTIADYARSYGPPANSFELAPNDRVFQWIITGQTAG
jgi:hypothetical protein